MGNRIRLFVGIAGDPNGVRYVSVPAFQRRCVALPVSSEAFDGTPDIFAFLHQQQRVGIGNFVILGGVDLRRKAVQIALMCEEYERGRSRRCPRPLTMMNTDAP